VGWYEVMVVLGTSQKSFGLASQSPASREPAVRVSHLLTYVPTTHFRKRSSLLGIMLVRREAFTSSSLVLHMKCMLGWS
jgi:hypothetical protein